MTELEASKRYKRLASLVQLDKGCPAFANRSYDAVRNAIETRALNPMETAYAAVTKTLPRRVA